MVGGVISGTTDAMTVKTVKLAMSSVIPVAGGVIADAAEAVVAGAGIVRSVTGIFGILSILAMAILPFLRLAIQYLTFRLSALLAAVAGADGLDKTLEGLGDAFSPVLALTGSSAALLLIGVFVSAAGVTVVTQLLCEWILGIVAVSLLRLSRLLAGEAPSRRVIRLMSAFALLLAVVLPIKGRGRRCVSDVACGIRARVPEGDGERHGFVGRTPVRADGRNAEGVCGETGRGARVSLRSGDKRGAAGRLRATCRLHAFTGCGNQPGRRRRAVRGRLPRRLT